MRYAIYGLFESDTCVYIGRTRCPENRARQHKLAGRKGEFRVLERFQDYFAANDHEMMLIAKWKPRDNRSHNCRKVAGSTRMPTDQAREIWRGDTFHTNAALVEMMPGWTVHMAIYHFGARSRGNVPGHYTVRKRELLSLHGNDEQS